MLTTVFKIEDKAGIKKVRSDNGNKTNEINGTKIRLIKGVNKLISKKVLITIGILDMNAIKLVINSFRK